MKIFRSLEGAQLIQPAVVTLGVFDGLHLGHQAIMRRVVERARAVSAAATVITFDPHPRSVLRPESAPPLLQTMSQKLEGLERLGIDQVLVFHFTRELSSLSADEFTRQIVLARLHVKEVYIGPGFAFGHMRAGGIETLRDLGREHGFTAEEVGEVRLGRHRISSTIVRRLLSDGDVNLARKMMGRPYGIEGRVIEGRKLGKTLSFPTANLKIENSVIPASGVYVTLALVGDRWHRSVANIGFRPTVGDQKERTVEAHLLEFDRDLYGAVMRLRFMHRLRDEKKFGGLEELKAQIARDTDRARRYSRHPLVRRHFTFE